MNTINVKMTDLNNGETVMREIDITNFTISMTDINSFPSKEKQTQIIEDWITQRAEPQHDTMLILEDFWIA